MLKLAVSLTKTATREDISFQALKSEGCESGDRDQTTDRGAVQFPCFEEGSQQKLAPEMDVLGAVVL